MEDLIKEIRESVKKSHKMMKDSGLGSPPQALIASLHSELQKTNVNLDYRSVLDAIDEMDARGWVISRANGTVIFDEAIL